MKARLLMLVMSSLLLSSCGPVSPPDSNDKEPVATNGNSQFTPAGIAGIKNAHKAVFDFTARPLKMSELGLGRDSDGALVAAESDQPIAVSMTTPNGVIEMETDTILPDGPSDVPRLVLRAGPREHSDVLRILHPRCRRCSAD